MPSHPIHLILDQLLFNGRMFPEVHKFLDMYQPLLQSNHRVLLHDMNTIKGITNEVGELEGQVAYFHILLDKISDRVGQERAVPILLEALQNGYV